MQSDPEGFHDFPLAAWSRSKVIRYSIRNEEIRRVTGGPDRKIKSRGFLVPSREKGNIVDRWDEDKLLRSPRYSTVVYLKVQ